MSCCSSSSSSGGGGVLIHFFTVGDDFDYDDEIEENCGVDDIANDVHYDGDCDWLRDNDSENNLDDEIFRFDDDDDDQNNDEDDFGHSEATENRVLSLGLGLCVRRRQHSRHRGRQHHHLCLLKEFDDLEPILEDDEEHEEHEEHN